MAEQIISTITLDLQHRNIANVNLKQYDTELRAIYITIADCGTPVDLTEYNEGYIQYQLPNGQFIVNTLELDPNDNSQYIVTISRAMVNMAGVCKADVTITDGDGVMSTMTFYVNVDESVVTSEEYVDIPEFQALVAYRNDAQQAADAAASSETNAATSEANAAASATAAAASASNAADSATNAASSATSASTYASNAQQSASSASASAGTAATMRDQAQGYANTAMSASGNAQAAANRAATSETNAASSAQSAASAASSATTSATGAGESALEAKAWAVGPNGTPSAGTDTENAKYYYQQVAALFASLAASIIPYDNTTSHMTADDVQEALDELKALVPFGFGVDSNGKYGYYKAGEQSITPFSSGAEGVLPVNPSSTTGMNIWIVTDSGDQSESAEIVY